MCSDISSRLSKAGLALPPIPTALGAYLPATRTGRLVFTAGQLPLVDGRLIATGIVAGDVDADQARQCARQCALNALAAASTVCDLDDVTRVVKLTGYVASTPSFTSQPGVIDGASEVMSVAFGEAGGHAREAVGVASLPMGAPVEISLVLELRA